jgi:hypothetical protein
MMRLPVIAARSKHRPFPLLQVLRRTVEGEQFDVRPGDWQGTLVEAFSSFSHFKTSQFRLCRRLLMNPHIREAANPTFPRNHFIYMPTLPSPRNASEEETSQNWMRDLPTETRKM